MLHSLEGAIFESAKSPQSLMDSRRREHGRWVFNPELFTLVTDAMDDPPLTPGGEKLALGDLVAVDPQVTFDNVARRVTRLKLFTVGHDEGHTAPSRASPRTRGHARSAASTRSWRSEGRAGRLS